MVISNFSFLKKIIILKSFHFNFFFFMQSNIVIQLNNDLDFKNNKMFIVTHSLTDSIGGSITY